MKITIKNLQRKLTLSPKRIKQIIFKTFSVEKVKKTGQISICFVNDKKIRELNLRYLGKDSPTDVLAFDNSVSKKEILVDIAISVDMAIHNAKIFKTQPLYELSLYVIHGLLHILGCDDKTPRQRKIMESKSIRILKALSPKP